MEANTVGIEAAREFLERVRVLRRGIKRKQGKIRFLREMATSTTATISDMPRSDSPNLQRMETVLCKAADLERELAEDKATLAAVKEEITEAICDLDEYKEQQALFGRYVECREWEDIAKACGYHKRTVQRHHDAGVEHLAMKMGG